jgi:K+-transporting ATPase ATPase A chain
MSSQGLVQLVVLLAALAVAVPPLGRYMAKVYGSSDDAHGGPAPAPGDRVFLPVERLIYRVIGVNDRKEQRWNVYAVSLLASRPERAGHPPDPPSGALSVNPTDMPAVTEFGRSTPR